MFAEDYGLDYDGIKERAKDEGLKVDNLIAMSPGRDPFYRGAPGDHKNARWFADVYNQIRNQRGSALHLRGIHYWAMSQRGLLRPNGDQYQNTDTHWDWLITASVNARYLGYVPMDGVIDQKNTPPQLQATYTSEELGFELFLQKAEAPYITVKGITHAMAQPYHLEIWCEKSTMNYVLLPLCQRFGANLVTFEGEVSLTAVCVNLMNRIEEADFKPTRIFYISDFDPAGNSIPLAMARKLEWSIREARNEGDYDVKVRPIALTQYQAKEFKLPRTPIKATESRAGNFEQNFGAGATELDALEALYPGALGQIVKGELEPYWDVEAARRVNDSVKRHRAAVTVKLDEISQKYKPALEQMVAMQKEQAAITVDPEPFRVERAEPGVDDEYDDWLYASQRPYDEQLEYYRAHQGKE